MRYAFSALAPIFADHVAVRLQVIHRRWCGASPQAAQFRELMVSGDFRHCSLSTDRHFRPGFVDHDMTPSIRHR
jgi:hypothetical protein